MIDLVLNVQHTMETKFVAALDMIARHVGTTPITCQFLRGKMPRIKFNYHWG